MSPNRADTSPEAGYAEGRYRHVIDALEEADAPIAVADLAKTVAERELTDPNEELFFEVATLIRYSLAHAHLPELAEVGLIEFNETRMTATLGESVTQTPPAEPNTRGRPTNADH